MISCNGRFLWQLLFDHVRGFVSYNLCLGMVLCNHHSPVVTQRMSFLEHKIDRSHHSYNEDPKMITTEINYPWCGFVLWSLLLVSGEWHSRHITRVSAVKSRDQFLWAGTNFVIRYWGWHSTLTQFATVSIHKSQTTRCFVSTSHSDIDHTQF